jgi:hypothetical protein
MFVVLLLMSRVKCVRFEKAARAAAREFDGNSRSSIPGILILRSIEQISVYFTAIVFRALAIARIPEIPKA